MTYLFQIRAHFTGQQMELQRIGDTAKKSTYVVGKSSTDTALSEDLFTQEALSAREKPTQLPKVEDGVDSNKVTVNGTSESSTPTNQSPKKPSSRRSSTGSRHSSNSEETNIDIPQLDDAKTSKEALKESDLSANMDEEEKDSDSKTNSRRSSTDSDLTPDTRGDGEAPSKNATEDNMNDEEIETVSIFLFIVCCCLKKVNKYHWQVNYRSTGMVHVRCSEFVYICKLLSTAPYLYSNTTLNVIWSFAWWIE